MRLSRRLRTIIAVATLGVIIGFAVVMQTIRYGFSALDEPTKMEATMATMMRRMSVPSDLKDAKNPVPLTPEVLAEGRAHFADHCASCHGNDGKGKTEIGQHLYPKAPDMTLKRTQEQSDGELFATIENGIRLTGMPGWGEGNAASAYGSWTLVHFIRHLPKITPQELDEMKGMNPISPGEMQEKKKEESFLDGEDAGEIKGESDSPGMSHH